jgi:Nucleotidyl transferase AbiEii toxin, Type IV TA system
VSSQTGYQTPAAFRRALTDRLKGLTKKSRWTLSQLQRQIAYDRLLERLYTVDEAWVVKGATALMARDIGVRGTIDVEIYREVSGEVAERELRSAAALDLGDWFRFELGAAQQMEDGKGLRVPVTAYVGVTVWVEFRVDLVGSDFGMTADAEHVPPLAQLLMPNIEQHGYRAYPLVDHIADKVAAILQRYGDLQTPSTRYRDLVDIVSIVAAAEVNAAAQQKALRSEAMRRGIVLPQKFDVPDCAMWERGYAAEARRSLLTTVHTLDDALAAVRPFIDDLLDETATGQWNPDTQRWES